MGVFCLEVILGRQWTMFPHLRAGSRRFRNPFTMCWQESRATPRENQLALSQMGVSARRRSSRNCRISRHSKDTRRKWVNFGLFSPRIRDPLYSFSPVTRLSRPLGMVSTIKLSVPRKRRGWAIARTPKTPPSRLSAHHP